MIYLIKFNGDLGPQSILVIGEKSKEALVKELNDKYNKKSLQVTFDVSTVDPELVEDLIVKENKNNPVCCFCGKLCENEYGNNPWPVNKDSKAKCCNECNTNVIIPARLAEARSKSAVEDYMDGQ